MPNCNRQTTYIDPLWQHWTPEAQYNELLSKNQWHSSWTPEMQYDEYLREQRNQTGKANCFRTRILTESQLAISMRAVRREMVKFEIRSMAHNLGERLRKIRIEKAGLNVYNNTQHNRNLHHDNNVRHNRKRT